MECVILYCLRSNAQPIPNCFPLLHNASYTSTVAVTVFNKVVQTVSSIVSSSPGHTVGARVVSMLPEPVLVGKFTEELVLVGSKVGVERTKVMAEESRDVAEVP